MTGPYQKNKSLWSAAAGVPIVRRFWHNGVEVPPGFGDGTQVEVDARTPKIQINLKGRLGAALYHIKVTIPTRI